MANSKSFSVVSRSSSGPAVRGRRKPRGRVIGENLGNYVFNEKLIDGERYNASHEDDYSDFGFSSATSFETAQYPSARPQSAGQKAAPQEIRHDGMTRQRQDETNLPAMLFNALSVAVTSLAPTVVAAFLLYIFLQFIEGELDMLRWFGLPIILTFYCGIRAGASAKRRLNKKTATVFGALGGSILAAGCIALLFREGLRKLVFYPSFIPIEYFELPQELWEFGVRLDDLLTQPFQIFNEGGYLAIPLAGVLCGWMFGRARNH